MENRINYGTTSEPYLYCKVSANGQDYSDMYDSSKECLSDIEENIVSECKDRGYNADQIKYVVDWYGIQIGNWPGEWKNVY